MAGNEGAGDFEDEFGDDTFDQLPANALQALEDEAIQSTQQPRHPTTHGASTLRYPVARGLNGRPPLSALPGAAGNLPSRVEPAYSFHQEAVINLDEHPRTSQQNFGSQVDNTGLGSQWSRPPTLSGHNRISSSVVRQPQKHTLAPPSSVPDITELQSRLQRLEREKAALKLAADAATAAAQAKAGETANLRQRLEKSHRDFEQKLQDLRQSHSEAVARQNEKLQTLQVERQKVETDRQFLEHDLAREVGRKGPRAGTGRTKTLPINSAKAAGTPRRTRTQPFGDGFDDVDVFVSPTKKRDQSKPTTPSHRLEKKRKRDISSPAIPVELALSEPMQAPSPMQIFSPFSQKSTGDPSGNFRTTASKDGVTLEFVQNLIDLHVPGSQDRLFEALTKHALPSDPSKAFSAVVFDQLSQRTFLSSDEDSPTVFCGIMCSLWDSSLKEDYHSALDLIISTLQYVVDSERFSFARKLVEKVVPLAMTTINLVALPIGRAAINANKVIESNSALQPPRVDSAACLNLLHSIALACKSSPDHINAFWRLMDLHFVLLLLMKAQPLHHIKLMLSLVRTSIRPTTFGAIIEEDENGPSLPDQDEAESHMIERLTALLFENPTSYSPEVSLELDELIDFHLSIIDTLQAMCVSSRSALSLASHKSAIGRLIHFLHNSIDALYSPTTTLPTIHDLTIQCVNTTMRLLYHLLTTNADKIDIREKLKVVEGGTHMHLIALTRLAFCESVILERGIEPEVSDAAHALLDEFLSPVEGEQLLVMFATGDSTAVPGDQTGPGAQGEPQNQGEAEEDEDEDADRMVVESLHVQV